MADLFCVFRKLSSTDVRERRPRFVRYQRSQQSASSIALLSLPPPFCSSPLALLPLYGFERKDNARHLALVVSSDLKTLSMSLKTLSCTRCLKIESQRKNCKSICTCTYMYLKKQKESLVIRFVNLLAVVPLLTMWCILHCVGRTTR